MKKQSTAKSIWYRLTKNLIIFFIVAIPTVIIFGEFFNLPVSRRQPKQLEAIQMSRQIGICLLAYSNDHNGHYPEGKTSTEIFQTLLDEQYASDGGLFYMPLPGKTKPHGFGEHINAVNVSWDVTCCVDSSAPDGLPVVFLTGYKINYLAGARALPINASSRTWAEWWAGEDSLKKFMAVCYKNNSTRAIKADPDGSIPNFIPADFDPKGKTYRQLTP